MNIAVDDVASVLLSWFCSRFLILGLTQGPFGMFFLGFIKSKLLALCALLVCPLRGRRDVQEGAKSFTCFPAPFGEDPPSRCVSCCVFGGPEVLRIGRSVTPGLKPFVSCRPVPNMRGI